MAPNRPPDPPRMAPEEPNCQHTGSPVRWETSGSDGPVVSPAGKSAADVAFTPDPPRIGPWKTILGEWCNGSTTGSEPVSLGSNPSSPVFISHAPRGFRHAGAGLLRERCRPLAGAQLLGDFAQLGFGTLSLVFLSRAEGLSARGCGPFAGALPAFGGSVAGLWSVPLAVGDLGPSLVSWPYRVLISR